MLRTVRILVLALGFPVVSILCLTAEEIEAERSGWSATANTQYHIQTDEGPERYFRFQTLNGQYRKEKRLEDGTVIGTEAWLDPLGYLRIKDYIADHRGYRILKSKMVHVGKGRPIEDAVAAGKRVPAQSGLLAKPRRPPNPFRQSPIQDFSSNSIEASTIRPYAVYSPTRSRYPIAAAAAATTSTTTENYAKALSYGFEAPYVQTPGKYSFAAPSLSIEAPPIYELNQDLRTSNTIGVEISPESSYGLYSRYQRQSAVNWTENGSNSNRRAHRGSTNYFSSLASNQRAQPYSRQVPTSDRGKTRFGKVAEYQFPPYDGHHTDSEGFHYYLKHQYHEEEQDGPKENSAIGSYGYVDPFGIRRVVYYKADPVNGFLHKKKNRYVGSDGTPYDPLPQ